MHALRYVAVVGVDKALHAPMRFAGYVALLAGALVALGRALSSEDE